MEATALSIGKSVLNGALSYAKSAVAEEVALQLGVRRDQLFITNELEMMQAFLIAAHEEGVDNMVVKVWVKQVRDVAYDVEDSLQEFAVRLKKQSWWHIRRMLIDRRRVAKQMKELRANVEDVSQRNMRYNIIKGSSSKHATTIGQPAVSGTTMSGIEEARRQEDKAKFDLLQIVSKEADLRVIAVWGKSTAEIGEMSIVKRVYEDSKIHKKFECRAWIDMLLHPFSLSEFLKSIVGQFFINFLEEIGEGEKATVGAEVTNIMGMTKEDDLTQEFRNFLKERSYFIVLSGIHTIEDWNRINTLFPDNKKGSRIIVPTKQVGVASLCVGAEKGALEHKQLFPDRTLHVFYKKGAQDGSNLTEAGTSSNADTASSDSSANKKMLSRTETIIVAFKESQLIGRETEKEYIIKLIAIEDIKLQVISLYGMGGLGKTTLVRDVYQDEKLSGKFEKRACATIMRPFNAIELLQNLASQFGYKDVPEMKRELPGKKFLIVLDDLSSIVEWDTIIRHFPATETSSRIIVTTREKDIAIHCSEKHEKTYELRILEDKNALELFTKKVFGKATNMDQEYPELVEHANLILKKCGGLPLAIVTIGGYLANQPKTVKEWRKLNEHIRAELVLNPELGTVRTILMRSYDGLPYHLKSCFLYMPIFPEDYMVRRKRLVRRWTAEGYSRELHGKSAEEILDSYFMELISRSMFLPSQQSIHGIKGIGSCQLHDLIRDISISKSTEENLVLTLEEGCSSNSQATMRHLTINGNWKGDQSEFENIVDLSRVRSLTVFGEWKSFFISDKMSVLRVLDLEDSTGLRDRHFMHIGKLLHLRYLSLRGCGGIHYLPDSLGKLRELLTLDVRGTEIVKMPKSIINLQKLHHLCAGVKPSNEDISYEGGSEDGVLRYRQCSVTLFLMASCLIFCAPCLSNVSSRDMCTLICRVLMSAMETNLDAHGVLVPIGIRKLKALHALGTVNIARRGNIIMQEIKRLTQLRKLKVTGVNEKNGQELCLAIVCLSRLETLSIRSEGEPGLSGCLDGEFSFPENLQRLKLYGNLIKLPKWIEGLKNLVKLKLRSCRISEHGVAMQVLGNLPNLAALHLLGESFKREEVHLTFCRETFQSLVVLEVEGGSDVKSVKFEERATPKLELLMVYLDQFVDSSSLSGLPTLSSLKEVVFINCSDYALEYVRGELALHPNRPIVRSD